MYMFNVQLVSILAYNYIIKYILINLFNEPFLISLLMYPLMFFLFEYFNIFINVNSILMYLLMFFLFEYFIYTNKEYL